jgi:hypothetical protein
MPVQVNLREILLASGITKESQFFWPLVDDSIKVINKPILDEKNDFAKIIFFNSKEEKKFLKCSGREHQ